MASATIPIEIRFAAPQWPARHVIGTLIADFDDVEDYGLSNLLGRTPVLPMTIRAAILAALATVMANPIAQLSKPRQSRAFDPQFDRALERDPMLTPTSIFRRHLT
jgi:hypothetical protein